MYTLIAGKKADRCKKSNSFNRCGQCSGAIAMGLSQRSKAVSTELSTLDTMASACRFAAATRSDKWRGSLCGWIFSWSGGAMGCKAGVSARADDESLIFVCELGPPPYAITDKNGDELTERWDEALLLRETVAQLWNSLRATPWTNFRDERPMSAP
jgi:hypothetical protein